MEQSKERKPDEQLQAEGGREELPPVSAAGVEMATAGAGGSSPVQAARTSRVGKEVAEWVKALAIAGVLVFLIRWFMISPFIVDGESMEPNFWNGERIMVNKILYDIREPKRGEVIVFHVPQEGRDFIKRVIGVAGDRVRVEGDQVFVNGEPIEEPYLREAYEKARAEGTTYNDMNFAEGVVPEGTLFVMGDNRSNSKDSRFGSIGYIPLEEVVGRAELIYWPLGDIRYIGRG